MGGAQGSREIRTAWRDARLQRAAGVAGSALLILLSVQKVVAIELSPIEAVAVVSYVWSVWLLARNRPLGWWIGLVGTITYAVVFYQVRLYAEVGIQLFYFVTSLQAIYIWLRGGENQTEKPVGRVPRLWLAVTPALGVGGVAGLRAALIAMRGAAPFWDALTTVLSLIAQIFLMQRYLESWYLWIAVDIIYVPLYASRGLYVTSLLYAVFLVLAANGLRNFRRILAEQEQTRRLDGAPT